LTWTVSSINWTHDNYRDHTAPSCSRWAFTETGRCTCTSHRMWSPSLTFRLLECIWKLRNQRLFSESDWIKLAGTERKTAGWHWNICMWTWNFFMICGCSKICD
jgi:hypothetical protein